MARADALSRLGSRLSHALRWGVLLLALWASSAHSENLKVGVTLTFYYDYNFIVAVVMAHLDLMKHFNSTIRDLYGPPILEIENPHPNLRTVEILTRECAASSVYGMAATQDLIFQKQVNVLVGDTVTEPCEATGALAAPNMVPHMSLCVGDALGDRTRYPFSFRNLAPMSDVYDFMWEYMQYFKFRSAILVYTSDGMGTSLNNIKDYAQQRGSGAAILSVPLLGSVPYDDLTLQSTATSILQAATRLLVVGARAYATDDVHRFLIKYELTKPRYQVLTSAVSRSSTVFSRKFIGWHCMNVHMSDADGSVSKWFEMRSKLTQAEIVAFAANYGIEAWAPIPFLPFKLPSDADLQVDNLNEMLELVVLMAFNTLNTAFVAMNQLLHKGYSSAQIRGELLRREILATTSRGVGKNTTFNSNSDSAGVMRFSLYTNMSWEYDQSVDRTILVPTLELMFTSTENGSFPQEIVPILWPDDTWAIKPPKEYNQCHPGMYIEDSGACGECKEGTISVEFDTEECTSCELGTYSNSDRTACLNCSAGYIAAERGLSACTPCPSGLYMSHEGASTCTFCPIGTYATGAGSTSCEGCPFPLSTADVGSSSPSSCICPPGTYNDGGGGCLTCGEGLSCVAGAALANLPTSQQQAATSDHQLHPYPEVEPGYYTTYEDPLSVYLCIESEYCPGGLPETCAENSVGIGCGNCIEGYYRGPSGSCDTCTSVMRTRGLLIAIPTFLIPVIYILSLDMSDITTWYKAKNMVPGLVYIALFFLQALAMYSMFSVELPENTPSPANSIAFTLDFRTLLRPECAEFYHYSSNFAAGLVMPLYFAVVVLLTWAISVAFSKYWSEMRIRRCCALSFFGSSYSTFYVSIANLTLNLFACYDHPNSKWSLRSASHELCYEDDWKALMGAGVAGIFIYCIAALVLMNYLIWQAPRYYKHLTYRLATKFLFVRFRTGCAWWSIVLLVKGLLVSVTAVLFTDGVSQFMWINIIFTIYVPLAASVLPWRSHPVAVLDIVAHMALCYVFGTGGFFVSTTDEEKTVVMHRLYVCVGCVAGAIVVCCFLFLCKKYQQDYKAKDMSAVQTELAGQIVFEMKRVVENPIMLTYLLKVLPDTEVRSFRAVQGIICREASQSMSVSCGLDPQKPPFLRSPSNSEMDDKASTAKSQIGASSPTNLALEAAGPWEGPVSFDIGKEAQVSKCERTWCVYV